VNIRRTIMGLAGLATVVGLSPAAVAGAAVASTEREPVHFTVDFVQPCNGVEGMLSVDGEATFHDTDTGSTYRFKVTTKAAFVFEPDDPSIAPATGRYIDHLIVNTNYGRPDGFSNERIITRAIVMTADGEQFPLSTTFVTNTDANGNVDVRVADVRCGG
jgi:hypothetical protein